MASWSDSGTPVERWPSWVALAAVVGLSAAACLRRIWEADFWWQQATGRWVSEHGPPSVDVFSYTAAGHPWIELRWLFCLGEFHVMNQLGPGALVLLKWLAVIAALVLVSLPALRGRLTVAAGATWAIALLASSQRMFVRPELATYVFFAVFVWILDRHRRLGGRWVWTLPVLQVLWVNTHTLFILGPILVGLLLAAAAARAAWRGEDDGRRAARRRLVPLAGVLAAVLAACLLNPWGLEGLLFPARLFAQIRGTAFKEAIGEFRSPFVYGTAFTAVIYYQILIGIAAVTALASWRRLDGFWSLLCLSQLYLSAQAIRNLPLFSLAAVPFVLVHLDRSPVWSRPLVVRWLPAVRRLGALAVAALCGWYVLEMATDRFYVRQNDTNQFGIGIAEHRYPVRAAGFLEQAVPEGRVFGTLFENSYLIHAGRQVFMDPRLEVYGEPLFRRFLLIQRDRGAWRQAVAEFDIRAALVDLQAPAAALLVDEPGWDLAYFDEVAAVFVKDAGGLGLVPIRDPLSFARALARVREELPHPVPYGRLGLFERVRSAGPYLAVADFLLICGQADAAETFLDDAQTASPRVPGMPLRRAALAELRGDWAKVQEHAVAGLALEPADARLQLKLGTALYRTGDKAGARTWLTRAVVQLPDRALAWGMLGNLHTAEGAFEEAARCYENAVELSPGTAVYRLNLAQVQAKLGRPREAIASLAAALELEPRNPRILRDLALVYSALGDAASARRYVERGLAVAPDDPHLIELGKRLGVK